MCKCYIRDGGLNDVLPPPSGWGVIRSLTSPPPKKIQELVFFLNQMKLMSKQFNTEFQKKARSYQLVQCNLSSENSPFL